MPVIEGALLAGKYRVERVLARGGMGVVCAAIHTQLDQRVALKFLLPDSEPNEHSRLRFLREARAAVRLRSEHVARVLDVGTAEEGAPYIVMEYLEGKDLADVLVERGRLPEAEAVGYVLQAAEAVAEAHALGIIHRDLKPANLFLTRRPDGSPCVKVLDFGISKALDGAPASGLTQATAMIGTPHYMSPEHIRSSKNVDARSDIWAMGMILYELVTGVVAFPRETLPELCSAIILDPIPPPRAVVPHLSEGVERALTITLAKAPENRPQSLAELAALLAPFAPEGRSAAARIARVLEVDVEVTDARSHPTDLPDGQVWGPLSDGAPVEEAPRVGVTVDLSPLEGARISDGPEEVKEPPARRSRVLRAALGALVLLGVGIAASRIIGGSPKGATVVRSATPEAVAPPAIAAVAPESALASATPPSVDDAPPAARAIRSASAPSPSPPHPPRVAAPKAPAKAAAPAADDFGARQ